MISGKWYRMNSIAKDTLRPVRPPFHVPQEDLTAWDDLDEDDYHHWQGQTDRSREEYREFLLAMNKEYDMEDAFDKIEAGLNALEVIVSYKKKFPKYILLDDLA